VRSSRHVAIARAFAAEPLRGLAALSATFVKPARTRYGADAWDAAAREGYALNFEDATAYALVPCDFAPHQVRSRRLALVDADARNTREQH
jgi:hypothetical protein